MPFLTEPEPPRGIPLDVLPGIRRIVARNPSVMTYHGTNTYLIDDPEGLVVLDPGPDDADHVRDIIAAAGAQGVGKIVLTHTHGDHYGAVAALREATSAPVFGYKISGKPDFKPDTALDDDDVVAGLKAVFTPGHALDHLCFAFFVPGIGKILFSGDHVMSWSSSIVNPPDGNMLDYYNGLELLLRRDDELYLGGHGPILPAPRLLVAELLAHRQKREASILAALDQQPSTIGALSEKLYAKTHPHLKFAAQRNVLAHLQKLAEEGVVVELSPGAEFEIPAGLDPQIDAEVKKEGGGELKTAFLDAARRFGLRESQQQ